MLKDRLRIAVTGMGIVSPLGCDVASFWDALCHGSYGIRPITRFDTSGFSYTAGGEITNFVLPDELAKAHKDADLGTQFMLTAALEALRDADLDTANGVADEFGVVVSTNFGGIISGEGLLALAGNCARRDPWNFREFAFQTCADRVAHHWQLAGPRVSLSLSCASGTAALAYGAELIRARRAKIVLTGGYDTLSRFAWSGLCALRTMTKDRVRPFDRSRDGTIFSEGAGALIVEEMEHARSRGARIHAELLGFDCNNNAFHMTAPAKEGAGSAAVMRGALTDAGLSPAAVDHINAHGTGTKPNDVTETQAIRNVFGTDADRIPVTSIKSMTGHMMGAAGSAEAIASILTIRDGGIPPTINYREPDPECNLDYVVNTARRYPVKIVLSNSAGIGGCNAAVILAEPRLT
ncbi:MAG: beta-ketoacyl-[acyl-carrier-protein] synthase family protein [Kiritimatiellae bacterium]|nr:beta-ketoacyl-[acyl-carrier-protein] synthase family protein [Kiritimatiellia bacterium]